MLVGMQQLWIYPGEDGTAQIIADSVQKDLLQFLISRNLSCRCRDVCSVLLLYIWNLVSAVRVGIEEVVYVRIPTKMQRIILVKNVLGAEDGLRSPFDKTGHIRIERS